MAPIVVYRIENDEHKGPFSCGITPNGFNGFHARLNEMDSPRRDFGDEMASKHFHAGATYFGFSSMEDFAEWVPPGEWALFRGAGFRLVRYMCYPGRFVIGESQVAFLMEAAKFLDEVEPEWR